MAERSRDDGIMSLFSEIALMRLISGIIQSVRIPYSSFNHMH